MPEVVPIVQRVALCAQARAMRFVVHNHHMKPARHCIAVPWNACIVRTMAAEHWVPRVVGWGRVECRAGLLGAEY